MRLFRKKQQEEIPEKEEEKQSDLKILCGNDEELYDALLYILLLDPRKLNKTVAETVKQAEEMQEKGNLSKAAYLYKQAIQLALYEGNAEAVEKFAKKYAELTGEILIIQGISVRAVETSQKYYKKHLSEPEEEEEQKSSSS